MNEKREFITLSFIEESYNNLFREVVAWINVTCKDIQGLVTTCTDLERPVTTCNDFVTTYMSLQVVQVVTSLYRSLQILVCLRKNVIFNNKKFRAYFDEEWLFQHSDFIVLRSGRYKVVTKSLQVVTVLS